MKCKKCGAEIESGFLYCPKCGESIQLVPNYDVVEEELLSRVVEDKDKAKDSRFATGVYKPIFTNKTTTKQAEKKPASSSSALSRNKRFILKLVAFLAIVIMGLLIIIPFAGSHSYDSLMNSAVKAEGEEQYAKALGYYQEAYDLDNASFEALYGLGRMYFKVKEYDNAIEFLKKALELDPANKKIYSYLLDSYSALDDTDSIYDLQAKAPNDEILALFDKYVIKPPEFSEPGGDYENDVDLVLTSNGGQIFYTLDGKNPTTSGKLFSKPIVLKEGTTEVKAVVLGSSGDYSEIVTEVYNISYAPLEMPVVTPAAGTFVQQEYITIEVPEGASAYYTWDGTDPATSGILYKNPFPIPNGTSVLSVVIIDSHGINSPVYHGQYILNF